MLRAFGDELWIADGSQVTAIAGFCYPTRMAVIRLTDGGLWVWSPVEPTPGLRAAVEALGPVRHLVAPNALHHLFLGDWMDLHPGAEVHAAPGLRGKRRDLAFDDDLGDRIHPDWAGQIDQEVVRGNLIVEEVVFFHRPSRTVLVADLLQQLPRGRPGWRGVVARLDLMTGDEPAVPRKFRLAFVRRRAARGAVGRLLDWPARGVVMAHGTPVEEDGQAFLRRAFAWLVV